MNPGDVVVCSKCGARSLPAHTTGGRAYQDGGALILTWTHGPYPRHDAPYAGRAPDLCLWCDDERVGFRSAGEGPLNVGRHGSEEVRPEARPDGNKAPLERSGQLSLL